MNCVVRSADRILVEGNAQRIVARSPHGEFGVMEGHAPILAVLVPGTVRLQMDGEERIIACKGGTFSLSNQSATVLVERPYTLEEIDPVALRAKIDALQTQAPSASLSEEIAYLELLCRVKETHG